jgi:hypothetical protein
METNKHQVKPTNSSVLSSNILDANKNNPHQYYCFNVPAPADQIKSTQEVNHDVAHVIDLFNHILKPQVARLALHLIDVYQSTKSQSGFSNHLYHSDEVHMDHPILGIIERQIHINWEVIYL